MLFARATIAAEGIYLTWDDCHAGATSSHDRSFACTDGSVLHELFAAFTVSLPIDSILGAELVVDIQSAAPSLPDWWRFDFGGCRAGFLRADVDFGARTACVDLWQGAVAGGVLSYTPGMPHGGTNQARIRLAFGGFVERIASPTQAYYASRILIESTGTDTCAGCPEAACIVLNGVRIKRPPRPEGAPSGDLLLTIPGVGDGNWATWQARHPGDCVAVPVRRTTWGQLKATYR